MKIKLHNGICSARWHCTNLNKKCCDVEPKGSKRYVECGHYKPKEKENADVKLYQYSDIFMLIFMLLAGFALLFSACVIVKWIIGLF